MIKIERAGVVHFNNGFDGGLLVNQDSFFEILVEELEKLNVPKDFNGAFAGRVSLEVDFYPPIEGPADE